MNNKKVTKPNFFKAFFYRRKRMTAPWWVKITTGIPYCLYYFGPFDSRQEALEHQKDYLEDLINEGALKITIEIVKCRPSDLTVESDILVIPSE